MIEPIASQPGRPCCTAARHAEYSESFCTMCRATPRHAAPRRATPRSRHHLRGFYAGFMAPLTALVWLLASKYAEEARLWRYPPGFGKRKFHSHRFRSNSVYRECYDSPG